MYVPVGIVSPGTLARLEKCDGDPPDSITAQGGCGVAVAVGLGSAVTVAASAPEDPEDEPPVEPPAALQPTRLNVSRSAKPTIIPLRACGDLGIDLGVDLGIDMAAILPSTPGVCYQASSREP